MSRFCSATGKVDVCAIAVTYNSASSLDAFVNSLRVETTSHSIRIVLVDNDSTDETLIVAAAHDDVILVESGGNLGYAGGINAARPHVGECDAVLILNPDLTLVPGCIAALLRALSRPQVGVVVPLLLDEYCEIYPSLRHEPSILGALGDAVLGSRLAWRPAETSIMVFDPAAYGHGHRIDWATGAALMVRHDVWDSVGEWDEQYFLYSEEVDYCRRIRQAGYDVWFEPAASARHVGAGSGRSPELDTLMAVNTIRYVENYHGRCYSAVFRGMVCLGELARSYDRGHRRTVLSVCRRSSWSRLPSASLRHTPLHVELDAGTVIIPAFDEATVIERTLRSLSPLAVGGILEVIVVCNGCHDDTAGVARTVPGITVIEIETPSKVAALNVGDDAAKLWPRIYLDADISCVATGVLATIEALSAGPLAARPSSVYDTARSSTAVKSYYRARRRVSAFDTVLWGAGCYGLSEEGHRRLGRFPDLIADDVVVDELFHDHEKRVVTTESVIVHAPHDSRSLIGILSRNYRGNHEVGASTAQSTTAELFRSVRGPLSAMDTAVYLYFAIRGRVRAGRAEHGAEWARDSSTR